MFDPLANLNEWKDNARRRLRRTLDRRRFLRGGLEAMLSAAMLHTLAEVFDGGAALGADPAGADQAVKTGTFFFPRLKFDVTNASEGWDVYPYADTVLRQALAKLTNINVSQEPVVVSLADFNSLRRYPFVFATDERHFRFPKNEEDNLREFLLRGGFVYGDDCVLNQTGTIFFEDYRKMMDRIYPDNHMRRVPDDHELYHCYFDFPRGLPFLQGKDIGAWATFDKESDRILTLVTPTDLHCGWTGRFFSPELNTASIQMGINIIMFYLTH